MITADILEPPAGDPGQALDDMGKAVAPLMAEAWKENGRFYGGRPFSLNAPALAQMWVSGDLKIFVAYDEEQKPCGYLAGLVFRPLQFDSRIFQITEWFGRTPEAERVLFQTALGAMKFLAFRRRSPSCGRARAFRSFPPAGARRGGRPKSVSPRSSRWSTLPT